MIPSFTRRYLLESLNNFHVYLLCTIYIYTGLCSDEYHDSVSALCATFTHQSIVSDPLGLWTIKYLLNALAPNVFDNLIINNPRFVKFWYTSLDNSESCFNTPPCPLLYASGCSQRVVDTVPLDVGEGEVHNPRNIAPDSSAAQRCKGL
jgi:hypothetical protein